VNIEKAVTDDAVRRDARRGLGVTIGGSSAGRASSNVPSAVVDELVFGTRVFAGGVGGEATVGGQLVVSRVFTEGAEALAEGLVRERLAACVNLLPATSIYRWRGALQRDSEVFLVLKSRAHDLPRL